MSQCLLDEFIVDVAAGWVHSLVLTQKGEVIGFGGSDNYQLGVKCDSQLSPIKVVLPERVVQVECGDEQSFFVTEKRSLFCLGGNEDGECAKNPLFTKNLKTPSPVKMFRENVKLFASGCNHFACYTREERLYLWGLNAQGQIGNNTNVRTHKPYEHTLFQSKVVALFLYKTSTAVVLRNEQIVNGELSSLFIWGENSKSIFSSYFLIFEMVSR